MGKLKQNLDFFRMPVEVEIETEGNPEYKTIQVTGMESSFNIDVFGRPTRETPCECERPREANLAQTLHLVNSPEVQVKVASPTGRLARLLKEKKTDEDIVEELYLLALARPPRPDERRTVLAYFKEQTDRKAAVEDLLWALVNTKEFLFSQSNNDRQTLQMVDKALARIREGSFGECIHCGKEINAKRLEAVPWTRHCIECQEKLEQGMLEEAPR